MLRASQCHRYIIGQKRPTGNPQGFKAGLSEKRYPVFHLFRKIPPLLRHCKVFWGSLRRRECTTSGITVVGPILSHRLLISGADQSFVSKPKVFTVEDLQRLPSVSRIHFIECSGNTGTERLRATAPTTHMVYCHALKQGRLTRKLWYRPKSSEIVLADIIDT